MELIFDEAEIRHLLGELLPVLQFVHDHQVIHCDIKPANIIRRPSSRNSLCGGDIILVDFEAAHTISGMEATKTLIGSAEYAAPEQIRGKPVFASDLLFKKIYNMLQQSRMLQSWIFTPLLL